MLAAPPTPAANPCDGLHTLLLYLGGERESLPTDCSPSPIMAAPESPAHPPTVTLADYRKSLRNPDLVPQAVRMALIIGSLVFSMNHGKALLQNEMNRDRWLSGSLSFVIPYLVSIYGQTQCRIRRPEEF
ncbi:MAG TPA: nitrate/nitrite transporter NrtS [Candidatus Obscuribacterales bacterium]